jgi:2-polyprenyl-6-methoxyphenol hydroxylase-like FAD-dependent oxidoreductase
MRPLPTIHIIGAGIGGLTLARCLKNKGIQAILFEKSPSPARHHYGISLQPRTCEALLKVLGMDESTFCQRVAVDGLNGGRGLVYPESGTRSDAFKGRVPFRAHRGRLEGVLRESLDVQWGHVLGDIESRGAELALSFKEKDEVRSTILVDTSGVHSPIRKALLPDAQLNILPYVVFRGTRHIDRTTFKKIYEPRFEGGNVLETKKGDVLLQISINDRGKNEVGVDISYIYSHPAHQDDQLHQPVRELQQAVDISEPFFAETSRLQELEDPIKDAFDGDKMRGDRILHWLMRDILVPSDDLKGFAERGIVLIGDAAHATPILGGGGANSALADAVELAEWIANRGLEDVGGFYEKRYGEWELDVKESKERLVEMHSVSRSSL